MNRNNIGKKFALVGAKAWTDANNEETQISGLFMVEDVVYPDRTCGQFEGGYWVFESGKEPNAPMWFVDDFTFFEQTDPHGYIRYLEDEKWQARKEEQFDAEHGDLFVGVGDDGDIPF